MEDASPSFSHFQEVKMSHIWALPSYAGDVIRKFNVEQDSTADDDTSPPFYGINLKNETSAGLTGLPDLTPLDSNGFFSLLSSAEGVLPHLLIRGEDGALLNLYCAQWLYRSRHGNFGGFINHVEVCHQGPVEACWLHFSFAVMLSIFILQTFLWLISSQCALPLPHATRAKPVGVTHRSRGMIGCLLTREEARLGFVY